MKRLLFISLCVLFSARLFATQIPAGIVIPVSLNGTIDSLKAKAGDRVSARVEQDVPLPSGRIRAGSRLEGRVVQVNATTLTLAFDNLRMKHGTVPVRTGLRAMASPTEVDGAQVPTSGVDRGTTIEDWTTRQVGGEMVYRGGGHVMRGVTQVGEPVPGGVLAALRPASGRLDTDSAGICQGELNGMSQPKALWVFSSDACGLYGYQDLSLQRSGWSTGQFELSGTKKVHLYSGTGLLLRVLPQ